MPDLYVVSCPHCGASGQLSDPSLKGTAIYCPACSKAFVIPAVTSQSIAPPVATPVGAPSPTVAPVVAPASSPLAHRSLDKPKSSSTGLLKVALFSLLSAVSLFGIFFLSQKAPQKRTGSTLAQGTTSAAPKPASDASETTPEEMPDSEEINPAEPKLPGAIPLLDKAKFDENQLVQDATAKPIAVHTNTESIANMRSLLTQWRAETSIWTYSKVAKAITATKAEGFGAVVQILTDPQSTPELKLAAGQVLALSWRTNWEDGKFIDQLKKIADEWIQPMAIRAGCAVALLKLKDSIFHWNNILAEAITDETVDWQVREAATDMSLAGQPELLSALMTAAEECEQPLDANRSEFEHQKRNRFYAGIITALGQQKSSDRSVALPNIVAAIRQDDRMVKMAALDTIATWGEGSDDAVEAIREALKHERPEVSGRAFTALGKLHAIATVAIPDLREALKSDDDQQREPALNAIGEFGAAANDVVPDLLALLADEKKWTASAVEALIKIAPQNEKVVAIVNQALQHPDRRKEVLDLLEKSIPAAQSVVPSLRESLAKSEDPHQLQVLKILSTTGEAGKSAVPEIVALLGATDAQVRIEAATALGPLKQHAEAAAPGLVKLLTDPDTNVQYEALLALARIGRWAKAVIPDVERYIANSTSDDLKDSARRTLENLKSDPGDGDPILFDTLLDSENFFEYSKAWEKQPEPPAKAVLKFTLNNNETVRTNAWKLLSGLVYRPQGRKILQRLFDESEAREKAVPAILLRRVPAGVDRAEFAKSLVPWIKSEQTNEYATWLLVRVGPPAATEVANVLTSNEIAPFYRERILDAACEFPGFETKPLLAQLKPRIKPEAKDQKLAAALAVSRLAPRDVDSLPVVLECLVNPDYELQRQSIEAIRGMAEAEIDVTAAIPELMKIITKELPPPGGPGYDSDFVLQAAFRAMRSIRARPQELRQLREILSQAIKVSKTANERKISQYIVGTLSILATVEPAAAEALPELKYCVELGLAEHNSKDGYGECLAKIGGPALQMLYDVAQQKNNAPAGRRLAMELLGLLAEQDERSVVAPTELLKDPDRSIRVAAVYALTQDPKSAAFDVGLPVMRQLLADPDPLGEFKDERRWMVERLAGANAKSGSALPEMIKLANDPAVSSERRFRTIIAVWKIAPDSEEVKALYLNSLMYLSAEQAKDLLSPWHKPPVEEVIKHLTPTIQATKEFNRTIAMSMLANLGDRALPAVPMLRAIMESDQHFAGLNAAITIAQIDSTAKDVVPRLLQSFLKDPGMRKETSLALRHLGPNAAEALPALMEALKAPFPMDEAFSVIGSMGPAAKPALPLLRAGILQDPPNSAAFSAISELGTEAAELEPELLKLWKENRPDDFWMNSWTTSILCRLGDPGRTVVAELRKDLADETKRLTAIYQLGQFGELAVPAIPELSQFATGDDLQLRLVAFNAISRIGPAAKDAAPLLGTALSDPDPRVSEAAAIALGSLKENAQPALPQIILALEKRREATQRELIDVLGNLGAAAKEAIPVLSNLAKSTNPALKWRARYALESIESPAP